MVYQSDQYCEGLNIPSCYNFCSIEGAREILKELIELGFNVGARDREGKGHYINMDNINEINNIDHIRILWNKSVLPGRQSAPFKIYFDGENIT